MPNSFLSHRIAPFSFIVRLIEGLPSWVFPCMAITLFSHLTGTGNETTSFHLPEVVLILPAWVGSLVVGILSAIFFLLLEKLDFSIGESLLGSVLLVTTTCIWPASIVNLSGLLECLAVLQMLFFGISYLKNRKEYNLFFGVASGAIAGVLGGFWALSLPLWGWWLLSSGAFRKRPLLRRIIIPLLVLMAFLILIGHLTWIVGFQRFWGSFGVFRLDHVLLRAFAVIASLGQSIFLYSPPLLLSIFGISSLAREHRGLMYFLCMQYFGAWAWTSFFDYGLSWNAWGSRSLLPLVPLLAIPAMWVLRRPIVKRWMYLFALLLFCGGALVQIAAVSWDHQVLLEHFVANSGRSLMGDPRFDPNFSPISLNLRQLYRAFWKKTKDHRISEIDLFKLTRQGRVSRISVAFQSSMLQSRLWWVRAWKDCRSRTEAFSLVMVALAGGLGVFVLLLFPWHRANKKAAIESLTTLRSEPARRRKFGLWRPAHFRRKVCKPQFLS